jgi:transcriptional regulator with XRE-family HTH domain
MQDVVLLPAPSIMDFPTRLAELRKKKGLTQQALADEVGMSLVQVHRYEKGQAQPTLEALRRLSIALGVTSDELIFGKDERGPDEELRLQFEAIGRFDPEERQIAKAVLDSLILQHEARRWAPLAGRKER